MINHVTKNHQWNTDWRAAIQIEFMQSLIRCFFLGKISKLKPNQIQYCRFAHTKCLLTINLCGVEMRYILRIIIMDKIKYQIRSKEVCSLINAFVSLFIRHLKCPEICACHMLCANVHHTFQQEYH